MRWWLQAVGKIKNSLNSCWLTHMRIWRMRFWLLVEGKCYLPSVCDQIGNVCPCCKWVSRAELSSAIYGLIHNLSVKQLIETEQGVAAMQSMAFLSLPVCLSAHRLQVFPSVNNPLMSRRKEGKNKQATLLETLFWLAERTNVKQEDIEEQDFRFNKKVLRVFKYVVILKWLRKTGTHMHKHTSDTSECMSPKRKDQLQARNKYTKDDQQWLTADTDWITLNL